MLSIRRWLIVGLTWALALSLGFAEIRYTLRPDPDRGVVDIEMRIERAAPGQVVRIPAWTPGFYFLQDFQNSILNLRAKGEDEGDVPVTRFDARGWRLDHPTQSSVRVLYSVRGDEPGLGFFRVNVRPQTTFVSGPGAFLFAEGRLEEPTRLTLQLPPGWDVATTMPRTANGDFRSADYDELVDHPIVMGRFERRTFSVQNIPFEAIYVTTSGPPGLDLDDATRRLEAVSRASIRMFGDAPFDRYLFIVLLAVGDFGGGLEHQSSSVMAIPNMLPDYFEELAAHEIFHAWNGKQIRPKVLGPFDYTREVRTISLWFVEGVTDYYGKLLAYRSGLRDREWLLDQISDEIRDLQLSRMRQLRTLEEASFQAWEHGGFGVGDLSYYTKGHVVAFLFDVAIRQATDGAKSLDDVMRKLYIRHQYPNPGFEEFDLLPAISGVAGRDLSGMYHQMVRTTLELPYEQVRAIGLRLLRPRESFPYPGFELEGDTVAQVDPELRDVGLREGDRILTVNGKAFDEVGLSPMLLEEEFVLGLSRGDSKLEVRGSLVYDRVTEFRLEVNPFATPAERRLLEGWLKR